MVGARSPKLVGQDRELHFFPAGGVDNENYETLNR